MQTLNAFKGMTHMPAYYELVTSRPALLAFYDRVKEKVFPEGQASCWKEGMFNPKTHLSG